MDYFERRIKCAVYYAMVKAKWVRRPLENFSYIATTRTQAVG